MGQQINPRVFADTAVTVGTGSGAALAANPLRQALYVHNPSPSNNVAISLTGGTAAINTAGSWTLGPGAALVFEVVGTNAITAIGAAAGPLTFTEVQ